jgi:hypothetical protein
MPKSGLATVKGLPRGVWLDDFSAWLTEARLSHVGVRRLRADFISLNGLPGERMLILTLGAAGSSDWSGAAGIVIEAGEGGSERWARITVQAVGTGASTDLQIANQLARAIKGALGDALRTSREQGQPGNEPPWVTACLAMQLRASAQGLTARVGPRRPNEQSSVARVRDGRFEVRFPLLPRGVYIFPLLDASTLRPVVFLIDRRQRGIHSFPMNPAETREAALARGEILLDLLDPPLSREPDN